MQKHYYCLYNFVTKRESIPVCRSIEHSRGSPESKECLGIDIQDQGTWGPMLCSNSIDKIGKFCQTEGQTFLYKKMVSLIPLACVDDVLAISNCGFDAIKVNTAINTIIELKKLEFHIPNQENKKKSKCHSLHVGKPNQFCPGMKVHGHSAERVNEALYLGDIIRTDGKNLSNIMDRVNKGVGIVNKIMDMLKSVSFGSKYFEMANTFREAHLINGMLSSAEIWYGLQKKGNNTIRRN